MLVHLLHNQVFLLLRDLVIQKRVDLPDAVIRTDLDPAQVKSLVQPEVLTLNRYPVVLVLVVHHPEGSLREVIEHHTAHQLVRPQDRNAQVAFLQKGQQLRVVVQLVEAVPHGFFLALDQELQSFDVIQFALDVIPLPYG